MKSVLAANMTTHHLETFSDFLHRSPIGENIISEGRYSAGVAVALLIGLSSVSRKPTIVGFGAYCGFGIVTLSTSINK